MCVLEEVIKAFSVQHNIVLYISCIYSRCLEWLQQMINVII